MSYKWLYKKYGQLMQPFEGYFDFCNDALTFKKDEPGKTCNLNYHYVIKNGTNEKCENALV